MIWFMRMTRHIRTICVLAIIAMCTFLPNQSRAQADKMNFIPGSVELNDVTEKLYSLFENGNYSEAVPSRHLWYKAQPV